MSEDINLMCKGHEAYLKHINITLFNDVVAFVMATTAGDVRKVRRDLSSRHLWYSRSENENIQTQYGFRYFGELLERFEDKTGSDIKNIRAIALAMAYAKELLTDDMFVGNQKVGFISKIARLSSDDIYLKGALYLLNKFDPSADAIFEELTETTYIRTEDLIFVVSLFDDFVQAVGTFNMQLVSLLGAKRTMPIYGNINVYAWLVRELHHYHKEKGIRSKNMVLLRALMEIPVSFVKTNSRYHGVLLDNGYSSEEIIYLNSAILDLRPVSNTIMSKSIVEEKMAVEFCKTFINSEATHHAEAYEHLENCLIRHKCFKIKINGYENIFDAIERDIKIANPQTFIWLLKRIEKKNVFHFNILDEKWDILSRELEAEEYLSLFEAQLRRDTAHGEAQVRERIQKYDALTGNSYVARFEKKYMRYDDNMFGLMVNKNIIDPISAFMSCTGLDSIKLGETDNAKPPMLLYLRDYIKGIRSRKAFELFKIIIQKHNFADMRRWFNDGSSYRGGKDLSWFFKDPFYKGPSTYHSDSSPRFDINRPFLSNDEQREILGWLDDYMFQYHADAYIEYTVLMLLDTHVSSLFPQNELRCLYDMVSDLNLKSLEENRCKLKQKYLSEAEQQAERDAEKYRLLEQERQAKARQLQSLRDELKGTYDGTFKSLLEFMDKHDYSFQNKENAFGIAAEYLETTLAGRCYKLDSKEISRFFRASGKLLNEGVITYDELKIHIYKIEEEAEYAENNTAIESDSDNE